MSDDMIKGLGDAIGDRLAQLGPCGRLDVARAAIAYLASQAPVEAGPEVPDSVPLPWITGWNGPISDATRGAIFVDNDDGAAAAVHRVNNWATLRAQLVAALAEVERLRHLERSAHALRNRVAELEAERVKLARERDDALARVAELETAFRDLRDAGDSSDDVFSEAMRRLFP